MGGYGSGRRGTRITVEDVRALDFNKLFKTVAKGLIHVGGAWCWSDPETMEQMASVGYDIKFNKDGDSGTFTLDYTCTRQNGDKISVKMPIRMECTYPNYGGKRWWLTCPLVLNNRSCGRRVSKLYSMRGCDYFGCRHCFNLTYTSCNESHQFDLLHQSIAARMGTTLKTVRDALKNGDDSYLNCGLKL